MVQFIFSAQRENIQHFLHDHTLLFFKEEIVRICKGCRELISGPCYGCIYCDFFLHYECARLPRQIEHFFHPCPLVLNLKLHSYICNACFTKSSGFSYRCATCDFNMDVDCALQPTISSENDDDEGRIQHFTHQHPLTLHDLSNRQGEDRLVFCAICGELCSDSTYGCLLCNFFLHNSCMTSIPRKINHFFHPCPLILLTHPLYVCRGCKEIFSGLTYSCGKCRFKLDVKCGSLPTVESRDAHLIQHFTHQHPLALVENKEADIEVGECRACGEDCFDSTFGCSISCYFFLHTSCAELPKEIHHPLHLPHPLRLALPPQQWLGGRNCDACSEPFGLFMPAYRCNWCGFNLHKDCAQCKPSFTYGNSLHHATLYYKRPSLFNCNVCGEKAKKIFLRCMLCEFIIHLYCQPSAPKTITHKCHMHSLTLTTSPQEFELNSPENADDSDDEFYCDVCEEKRDKKEPVYYCAECRFIAEAGCVISELVPSLITSEDQNAMSIQLISEEEDTFATLELREKLLIEECGPLKAGIESLSIKLGEMQTRLQETEAEINQITQKLDNLEVKRFLFMYQPKHSMKENMYSNRTSTSEGLGAEQP